MSFSNPYIFLQTFKGAPLSCLLVLLLSPHPMGSTDSSTTLVIRAKRFAKH